MAIRSSLSRICYKLLWSKEQRLNWLINDQITVRECHTVTSRHILCNTSCHLLTPRHFSQNSEIEDLLLLVIVNWKPRITESLRFLSHKILTTLLSFSHLNRCHVAATGAWSRCYSWVCVTPTVIPALRNLDTEDAPLLCSIPGCTWAHTHHHRPRAGPLGHWSPCPHMSRPLWLPSL